MRNGLVQLGAWAAATGAAVALSWLGVHTVLAGAAFEQPTALSLPSPASADGQRPTPTPSATQPQPAGRTEPAATPSTGRASAPPPRATASAPPSPTATATARPAPATSTTSSVHSYPVPGGRVAVDLQSDHASLVSATPDSGWQMQVWNGPQWFRVDFTKDDQANSVIVSWNGYPPRVDRVVR
ncbi:hypothetical protein ACFXAF_02485 [Kitasatospora sp. NPDC059463]|uniref:hypothetical protein n=1 Tax=unclassified Kitasatospora TaxID=2633591 RepID=UPI003699CA38